MRVKEIPINERPREKAFNYGIEYLSDRELLALLIRSGTKKHSAIEIADLLLKNHGGLRNCLQLDLADLMKQPGIKKAKGLEILASIELAKRMLLEEIKHNDVITHPKILVNWFNYQFKALLQEIFVVVFLNVKNEVMDFEVISKGGLSSAPVHTRDVFRKAIVKGVDKIVCLHNHPSNDITPSAADTQVTKSLLAASKFVNIPLLDHLIIGGNKYYSFRENKQID
ncbi:MAG: RadC family protein [Erysipelotrichaceae bacterium]